MITLTTDEIDAVLAVLGPFPVRDKHTLEHFRTAYLKMRSNQYIRQELLKSLAQKDEVKQPEKPNHLKVID